MLSSAQLSHQGFFTLEKPVEATQSDQDLLLAAFNAMVPNPHFKGHRRVRGNTTKVSKPWEVGLPSFCMHPTKNQPMQLTTEAVLNLLISMTE